MKFINSTIGMMTNRPNSKKCHLVRFEFYRLDDDKIKIVPVSGHNLSKIRGVPCEIITVTKYNERPYDACEDQVEFWWAANLCGWGQGEWESEE